MSGSSSPYISRKEVNDSYRPRGYGLSPGLLRARQRFRVRNLLTGAVIASFGVGVWAYSISAVKQDTFDDADEEAKALAGSRESSLKISTTQKLKPDGVKPSPIGNTTISAASTPTTAVVATSSPTQSAVMTTPPTRGLLASWIGNPWILDPTNGTLIHGAPPVDRIGRLGDK